MLINIVVLFQSGNSVRFFCVFQGHVWNFRNLFVCCSNSLLIWAALCSDSDFMAVRTLAHLLCPLSSFFCQLSPQKRYHRKHRHAMRLHQFLWYTSYNFARDAVIWPTFLEISSCQASFNVCDSDPGCPSHYLQTIGILFLGDSQEK